MMDGKKIGCQTIIRMVQFVNLGSIIFRTMSLPQKIRMVAPVWVIKI
jgi:hypothetical protein